MSTFTSSLPDDLLQQLTTEAQQLKMPKNKLIERALRLYLKHLTRIKYIQSYKQMNDDEDILLLAEENMEAYAKQINSEE